MKILKIGQYDLSNTFGVYQFQYDAQDGLEYIPNNFMFNIIYWPWTMSLSKLHSCVLSKILGIHRNIQKPNLKMRKFRNLEMKLKIQQ